jgi:hypothetical protein
MKLSTEGMHYLSINLNRGCDVHTLLLLYTKMQFTFIIVWQPFNEQNSEPNKT